MISDLLLSPDENYLYSCSFDTTLKCADLINLKLYHSYKGHKREIMCGALSRDGTKVYTGGFDRKVKDRSFRLSNIFSKIAQREDIVSLH